MLTSKGYKIYKNDNYVKIIDELTVKPFGDFMNNESNDEFCVCLETSKHLYVPKYYGLQKFGLPNEYKLNEPANIDIEFSGNVMDKQKEPIDAFLNAASDPLRMGGILQLPPGFGKTVMALYIISKLRVKTLIIVHKEFLMNQWKERIAQYLPNCSVGIIKQNKVQVDNNIVIASLQSLCMRSYDEDNFKDFGFLIIDECHHVGAQVFSKALFKVNFKYTLGLSATVNRKDGLTKVFKWFLGDILYKIAKKENIPCIVKQIIINDTDEQYRKEYTLFNGKVNIAKMITNISSYIPRTLEIVNQIKAILEENTQNNRKLLVLSDRKQHLIDIGSYFEKEQYGFYMGGMKEIELEKSKLKQIILGTFNMISEGFDLPSLDTLILASPKSDVEQSIGRIQRKHVITENDNIPLVIDIIDNFSLFEKQANKRKNFYKKMKYEMD